MPTVDIPPVRLPSIDALSDPDALAAVVGPVVSIERSPLVALVTAKNNARSYVP